MTVPPDGLVSADSRDVPAASGEVRAFLVVRDEVNRLPHLLAHHRRLGVTRFFVVDNGSIDGSREFAQAQPDVHLFTTTASYQAANLGIDWIVALLDRFGDGAWCLLVDADEQLVYRDCERVPIPDLCARLEALGLNCLVTMFVDLYGDGPLLASRPDRQRPLLDACPFFDRSGYTSLPVQGSVLPRLFGGVRARLFWPELDPGLAHGAMHAAAAQAFDEGVYLALHRDVAAAVADGVVASGWDHYRAYGWRESRPAVVNQVTDWPETAYLAAHADVRDAVRRGAFSSGLDHYVRFGQFEGRLLADWPPCLTQVPLLRWDRSLRLLPGRHGLHGARWLGPQVIGGALLHFRLMADAIDRARTAATRPGADSPGAAWNGENRRYASLLAQDPQLSAFGDASARYTDVDDLLALGLITDVVPG